MGQDQFGTRPLYDLVHFFGTSPLVVVVVVVFF